MSYYVYILYSEKLDKYYVGSSDDPTQRLQRHNKGHTTFTKTGIPWIIVYTEAYPTRAEAYRREQEIKKRKSRVYVEQLIRRY